MTTQAMAKAAQEDLKVHGVDVAKETAWQAVEAALAVAGSEAVSLGSITQQQVDIVWGQLNSSPSVQVSRDQVRDALLLIIPAAAPVPPTATRPALLEQAAAIVDSTILASVTEATKSNGYKADSYRYPSLAERTQAILDLAAFMAGEGGR
jgi:hypothetical protein